MHKGFGCHTLLRKKERGGGKDGGERGAIIRNWHRHMKKKNAWRVFGWVASNAILYLLNVNFDSFPYLVSSKLQESS